MDHQVIKAQHDDWVTKHSSAPLLVPIPEEFVVYVMKSDLDKQADFLPIADPVLRDNLYVKRKELACSTPEVLFQSPSHSIEKIKTYLKLLPLSTGTAITYHWNHNSSQSALLDRVCLTYNLGCLYLRAARNNTNPKDLEMAAKVFEHLYQALQTQSFVTSPVSPKQIKPGPHNLILSWPENEVLDDLEQCQLMALYMMRFCLALQCQTVYQHMVVSMDSLPPPPNTATQDVPLIRENLMLATSNNLYKNYWLLLHYMSSAAKQNTAVDSASVILPDMVRHYRHFVYTMTQCMQAIANYHACRIALLRPTELKRLYAIENNYPIENYRGVLSGQLNFYKGVLTNLLKDISTRSTVSSIKGMLLMQKSIPIATQESQLLESCLAVISPLAEKLANYIRTISHDPIPISLPSLTFLGVVLPVKPDQVQQTWFYEMVETTPLQGSVPLVAPAPSLMDKIKSSLPFLKTERDLVPSISGSMYVGDVAGSMVGTLNMIQSTHPNWSILMQDIAILAQKREKIKEAIPDYIAKELLARENAMLLMLQQQTQMSQYLFDAIRATVDQEATPFYANILKS